MFNGNKHIITYLLPIFLLTLRFSCESDAPQIVSALFPPPPSSFLTVAPLPVCRPLVPLRGNQDSCECIEDPPLSGHSGLSSDSFKFKGLSGAPTKNHNSHQKRTSKPKKKHKKSQRDQTKTTLCEIQTLVNWVDPEPTFARENLRWHEELLCVHSTAAEYTAATAAWGWARRTEGRPLGVAVSKRSAGVSAGTASDNDSETVWITSWISWKFF